MGQISIATTGSGDQFGFASHAKRFKKVGPGNKRFCKTAPHGRLFCEHWWGARIRPHSFFAQTSTRAGHRPMQPIELPGALYLGGCRAVANTRSDTEMVLQTISVLAPQTLRPAMPERFWGGVRRHHKYFQMHLRTHQLCSTRQGEAQNILALGFANSPGLAWTRVVG